MSDRAATILAGAIIFAALAYFATHLYGASSNGNWTIIYNTVTGNAHACTTASC